MAIGKIWGNIWDEAIWDNAIWEQLDAALLVSATIGYGGSTMSLRFDQPVQAGAGGTGGFVPTLTGGAATLTYASGLGTAVLVYSVSRAVAPDETGTLAYTQPGDGIENLQADDVLTFAGFAITIGSLYLHNRASLLHNRSGMTHTDTTDRHNRTTIQSNA